ncbi:DUF3500 domain-containing protein [Rhodobacteraceae bacterium B1Z28]|uniref:DUF3500 domain-containing protein n=1 Tax=Ruegeria haliotis TaxID=2747601 RepID=A0ABX2PWP5_9RHOB|nr:DUF3500 domain-containing protein [Ruegeria haliotis]NVO57439.1 DUF3500 domain-containing protein [Ruegeria haliotis]
MRSVFNSSLLALGLATALAGGALAHDAPRVDPANLIPIPAYNAQMQASGAASTKAAQAFLETLTDAQREIVMMSVTDAARKKWSNLPAGIVDRSGLRLGDLNADQLGHFFEFLSAALDADGYERVAGTMAAEAYLSTDDQAKRLQWAPENYWLAFYGTPASDQDWAWQFGGHHLGLNLTIKSDRVDTMSPSFLGTEPAIFTYNGVKYENINDMHLAGWTLYDALDAGQKESATLTSVPRDISTGPGNDDVVPPVAGITGADLTEAQQQLLLATIEKWVGVQPDENAEVRMVEIAAELDQVHFAWIGDKEVNTDAYFRIQGPSLVIEMLSYSGNVGSSADGMGHYHTQYRNLENDYGNLTQ